MHTMKSLNLISVQSWTYLNCNFSTVTSQLISEKATLSRLQTTFLKHKRAIKSPKPMPFDLQLQ